MFGGDQGAEPTPARVPARKELFFVGTAVSTLSPIRASMWLADLCCSFSPGTCLGVQSAVVTVRTGTGEPRRCAALSVTGTCLRSEWLEPAALTRCSPARGHRSAYGRRVGGSFHSLTPFSPNTRVSTESSARTLQSKTHATIQITQF